jgi:hypothetical protein
MKTAGCRKALRLFEANLRRFEEHRDVLKKQKVAIATLVQDVRERPLRSITMKKASRYGPRRSRAAGSDGASSQRCSARWVLAAQKEISVSLHKK